MVKGGGGGAGDARGKGVESEEDSLDDPVEATIRFKIAKVEAVTVLTLVEFDARHAEPDGALPCIGRLDRRRSLLRNNGATVGRASAAFSSAVSSGLSANGTSKMARASIE